MPTLTSNYPDIRVDITSIYNAAEYGLILYTSASTDTSEHIYKFYSKETYRDEAPFLDIYLKREDETFVSGSLTFINLSDNPIIYSYNNPYEIEEGSVIQFRLKCRKKFPDVNQYTTESILNTSNLINGNLTYRINNLTTGQQFIPFGDNRTVVYYDASGYYFYVDFTNFPINCHYTVDIKMKQSNELVFLNVIKFKVI